MFTGNNRPKHLLHYLVIMTKKMKEMRLITGMLKENYIIIPQYLLLFLVMVCLVNKRCTEL